MAVATPPRKVINRRVRYETELAAQKKEGHPFFPYAMFHDTVVNLIIVLMIVAMAVVWHATSGPIDAHHPDGQNGWLGALYEGKANPAVQVTEPRPEWYFLFLFELLRIFKTPWELIFATIIIPTIMMILLVVWPFLDRGRDRRISRRPVGMAFGLSVPAVLIALTIAGGLAPGVLAGSNISNNPDINKLPGAALIAANGCSGCHQFPTGGAPSPGANLSNGSPKFGTDQKAIAAWVGGGAAQAGTGMPSFASLGKEKLDQIAQVIASLKTNSVQPLGGS
ncbi:MAG TPA: c-type cytochrome [Gaiellales bacterium]|jgi:mono/diheme cytochrome c family protein|nr:c-type cytochrome [Gaiellales bacterium]